jgi:GNAT superfamily N-acetyltransferase
MNTPFQIRIAVFTDAPRLAELSGVLGYPVPGSILAERLATLAARSDDTVLVAELCTGEIIGWVHGSEQELLQTGRRCEILGLVVDAAHRGKGVGRELVRAVERWARGRGLEQIAVRSATQRAEAHPFYERLGYVCVKTQRAYRKQLGAVT